MKLEQEVHTLFRTKKKTLIAAESCTGGWLSARLTSIPGASNFFLGSIVAYDNIIKKEVLKVSERTIKEKGAVSPETAKEMVLGALALSDSDYAIAVTGIAGPTGGTPDKPVGTVWGAICKRNEEPFVWKINAKGTREKIIQSSVDDLLNMLIKKVNEDEI